MPAEYPDGMDPDMHFSDTHSLRNRRATMHSPLAAVSDTLATDADHRRWNASMQIYRRYPEGQSILPDVETVV